MKQTVQHPCQALRDALCRDGLFDRGSAGPDGPVPREWRIGTTPFPIGQAEADELRRLGQILLDFSRALNRLYFQSLRGAQPGWVAGYLDQGKPDWLLAHARMKRGRDELPAVIRPDILLTDDGLRITELDSVPGGMGLTGSLTRAYAEDGRAAQALLGGEDGMPRGLARMLREKIGDRPGCVAIVVSEESRDYRPEMAWLATRLRELGLEAYCVEPRELRFTEESLLVPTGSGLLPVAVLYRFFELFDLRNVPKSELVLYAAKKGRVVVTPPFKPALEEKLAFALLQHPELRPFWLAELGEETVAALRRYMPRTWILDPRPIPPSAVIPDLELGGRALSDWRALAAAGQKERRFVIKPSGFSELAWGSRGVSVGHDLSQADWAEAVDRALDAFPDTPHILQEFHKGRQVDLAYYDLDTCRHIPMAGRVRLSPYYFVVEDRAELAGALATICPPDKKVIHGMRDAVMVPCSVKET